MVPCSEQEKEKKTLYSRKNKSKLRRFPIKISKYIDEYLNGTATKPKTPLTTELTVEESQFVNDKEGDRLPIAAASRL